MRRERAVEKPSVMGYPAVSKSWLALLLTLIGATGAGVAIVDVKPDTFAAIVGGLTLLIVYVTIALRRQQAALVIGLFLLYNPVFSYFFLLLKAFSGGRIRVMLSLLVALVLMIAAFRERFVKGDLGVLSGPPLFKYIVAWLYFPLLGFAIGILFGNPPTEIFAELAPILEFVAYFWISSRILRSSNDAKRVIMSLVLWGGLVAAIEVFLYAAYGMRFALRVESGGLLLSRLTDFMPVLLFPIGSTYVLALRHDPLRRWIGLATISMGAAIFLGFYRSVWISVLAGLLFVALLLLARGWRLGTIVQGIARGTLLVVAVFAALSLLVHLGFLNPDIVSLGNILERFNVSRLAGSEAGSSFGRLIFVQDVVEQGLASFLWGHGLGAPFYSSRAAGWLPISDSPVFYLNILYELGLLAFISYLVLFIAMIKKSIRAFWHTRVYEDQLVSAGLLGGLLAASVQLGIFPSLLHFPIPAYVAVILMCLHRLDEAGIRLDEHL